MVRICHPKLSILTVIKYILNWSLTKSLYSFHYMVKPRYVLDTTNILYKEKRFTVSNVKPTFANHEEMKENLFFFLLV